jgi:hypothetical protein
MRPCPQTDRKRNFQLEEDIELGIEIKLSIADSM